MNFEKLTKKEKAWVKAVSKLLTNPPSTRLGLYTIGDPELTVYDRTKDKEILSSFDKNDGSDFCLEVNKAGAWLGVIKSACPIHSTAG